MTHHGAPQPVVRKTGKSTKHELREQKNKERHRRHAIDLVKFVVAAILVVAGIVAFYVSGSLPSYVRALFPIVGVLAAFGIVFFATQVGESLRKYFRESLVELRKVVWPKRDETIKTSIYVMLFVVVLALVIWAADSVISYVFYDILLKRS